MLTLITKNEKVAGYRNMFITSSPLQADMGCLQEKKKSRGREKEKWVFGFNNDAIGLTTQRVMIKLSF